MPGLVPGIHVLQHRAMSGADEAGAVDAVAAWGPALSVTAAILLGLGASCLSNRGFFGGRASRGRHPIRESGIPPSPATARAVASSCTCRESAAFTGSPRSGRATRKRAISEWRTPNGWRMATGVSRWKASRHLDPGDRGHHDRVPAVQRSRSRGGSAMAKEPTISPLRPAADAQRCAYFATRPSLRARLSKADDETGSGGPLQAAPGKGKDCIDNIRPTGQAI